MKNEQTIASGCYPRHPHYTVRTGDPPPYTPMWPPAPNPPLQPRWYGVPGAPVPSIAEQMGIDPISKLAAAIDRLAAALEKRDA